MTAINSGLVVIDTNVALDLWLFGRRGLDQLHRSLQDRRQPRRFVATPAMRDELAAVLCHSQDATGPIDSRRLGPGRAASVLASWDHHLHLVDSPPIAPATWPRCRDAADQKFVDLALATRASWLLTRDRDLLKLARRCRAYGLVIAPPETLPA